MKTVLVSLAAAGLLASSAFASSEPRCWYGNDRPFCRSFQSTNATGNDKGGTATARNLDTNHDGQVSEREKQDARDADSRARAEEFDHDRETTRPY